jgi:hypothetical protein
VAEADIQVYPVIVVHQVFQDILAHKVHKVLPDHKDLQVQ